jgi:hypothetical protein
MAHEENGSEAQAISIAAARARAARAGNLYVRLANGV